MPNMEKGLDEEKNMKTSLEKGVKEKGEMKIGESSGPSNDSFIDLLIF